MNAHAAFRFALIGLLAASGLVRGAETAAPDLVIHNAKVTTQDASRPEAQAIAVSDGKILAVGDNLTILGLRGAETQVIDAGGRRIIPGLNDSHLHPTRGGRYYAAELRWDGVPSLRQALQMVREAAKATPAGQWVRVVGGWSPYQFEERRMPTPQELTEAAPNTPVFVLHLYSGGIYNRKGLETAGITRDTVPPEGGTIQKDAAGNPTGVILATPRPTILYRAVGALGELPAEAQLSSVRHFYRELNRFGLTSAIDASGGGHNYPADYAATETLAKQGQMPIRISVFLFAQKPGSEFDDYRNWVEGQRLNWNLDSLLEYGYGIEGAGENLVWAAGDFENFQADRPDLDTDPRWRAALTRVVRLLVQKRWPIRIHATYDETIDRILSVFEGVHRSELAAGRPGFTGLRWAIDHAETIRPAQIERIKALGGGVLIQNRMAFAGEDFLARYGAEAAGRAPPIRALLDAGIPVAAGTDGTRVSSYNPWLSMYWLVTGKSVGGTVLLSPENRVSRAEALRLYTAASAWFTGEEALKGRIAPGQFADFAVLNADYFAISDEGIRHLESVLTVTGGRVVYGSGPFAPLMPDIGPLLPAWSPVNRFGGYVRSGEPK